MTGSVQQGLAPSGAAAGAMFFRPGSEQHEGGHEGERPLVPPEVLKAAQARSQSLASPLS